MELTEILLQLAPVLMDIMKIKTKNVKFVDINVILVKLIPPTVLFVPEIELMLQLVTVQSILSMKTSLLAHLAQMHANNVTQLLETVPYVPLTEKTSQLVIVYLTISKL